MAKVAEYGFAEGTGTTTADSSGNSRTLTASGSPWTASGHTGGGLACGSGKGYFSGTLGTGTVTSWTVMFWYKHEGAPTGSYGQFIYDGSNFWAELESSTNKIDFNGGVFSAALTVGTWYHVAFVSNGTTITAYLNGASFGTTPDLTGGIVKTRTWSVGSDAGRGDGAPTGTMDDVRFFDTALTSTDISTWMSTPVGLTRVTKTVATSWNVRARVTKTAGSAWAVRARIAATTAMSWAVRSRLGKSASASWAVRARVVATASTSWGARARMVATAATSWAARTRTGTTASTSWAVRSRAVKTAAATWAVLTRISTSIGTTWSSRARVVASIATAWAVRSRVAVSVSTSWDVAGSSSRVIATFTTSWAQRVRLARMVSTSWAARARVAKTTATTWAVLTRQSATRPTSWSVMSRTAGTWSTSWRSLERRSLTEAVSWAVLLRVVAMFATSWSVVSEVVERDITLIVGPIVRLDRIGEIVGSGFRAEPLVGSALRAGRIER